MHHSVYTDAEICYKQKFNYYNWDLDNERKARNNDPNRSMGLEGKKDMNVSTLLAHRNVNIESESQSSIQRERSVNLIQRRV